MFGLGTIFNTAAIIVGGLIGLFAGGFLKERHQETIQKASGVSVVFIGISGAMEGMLKLSENGLSSGGTMMIVLSLTLGAVLGEILNIEGGFERFGEWLKQKTGNARDARFVDGFVTASLTVCIGAMAIVGSIKDGIYGDYSILFTKGILDLTIIIIMTGAMGKGCIFSAIPVFILQGSVTLLSRVIEPILTENALANLSTVGSILIFCVGVNLVWGKKVKVANILPAILFAVAAAYIPYFQ